MTSDQEQARGAVLLYHRVCRRQHDAYNLAIAPELFRAQMQHLVSQYHVVPLTELVDGVMRRDVRHRSVAITFDDGYIDNLEIASPILLELGLPATFFIPSHGLRGEQEFWWDTLARILLSNASCPPELELWWRGTRLALPTVTPQERRDAHGAVYHRVRSAPAAERNVLVQRIAAWGGGIPDPTSRPVDLSELRQLAERRRHTIGGHGADHISYPAADDESIREDLNANRRLIEQALERTLELFAYPFGEHDDRSVGLVREGRYSAAVTCMPSPVDASTDPLRIPRFEVGAWDVESFAQRVGVLIGDAHAD